MFEKNLTISYLLDFYGELLADRRRELMSLYYNEDYSLSEIAAEVAARFAELQALSHQLEVILASPDAEVLSAPLRQTLADICERLK